MALNVLVILDLDQTLIDMTIPRPGLRRFLNYLFSRFRHVAIWTAASLSWARYVLENILEMREEDFRFVYSEKQCVKIGYDEVVKPLSKIWKKSRYQSMGISKKNTIIIDDNPDICVRNYGNHLQVPPFDANDPDDYTVFDRIINLFNDGIPPDVTVWPQMKALFGKQGKDIKRISSIVDKLEQSSF